MSAPLPFVIQGFNAANFSPPLADSTVATIDGAQKQGLQLLNDVAAWVNYMAANPGDTAGLNALGTVVSNDVAAINTTLGTLPAIPVQG